MIQHATFAADPRIQALRRQREFQNLYQDLYAIILAALESGASVAEIAQRVADVSIARFEQETDILRSIVQRQAEEIRSLAEENDRHHRRDHGPMEHPEQPSA